MAKQDKSTVEVDKKALKRVLDALIPINGNNLSYDESVIQIRTEFLYPVLHPENPLKVLLMDYCKPIG